MSPPRPPEGSRATMKHPSAGQQTGRSASHNVTDTAATPEQEADRVDVLLTNCGPVDLLIHNTSKMSGTNAEVCHQILTHPSIHLDSLALSAELSLKGVCDTALQELETANQSLLARLAVAVSVAEEGATEIQRLHESKDVMEQHVHELQATIQQRDVEALRCTQLVAEYQEKEQAMTVLLHG
ncbi:hypothetical protein LTR70_010248 [Exophiala xenobiotica]|uniref:Uncharacterized protein n=1 Tax=Lithohypha guttulata TaxID=1690604 RepID=A0ABR0JVC9_9EURO|nr:hypothetical protein LTR24_010261 [Lithohypha guttulata]KAK5309482.1 hypothetical protein LTR70_010248 [Exophiala xenobiotica]